MKYDWLKTLPSYTPVGATQPSGYYCARCEKKNIENNFIIIFFGKKKCSFLSLVRPAEKDEQAGSDNPPLVFIRPKNNAEGAEFVSALMLRAGKDDRHQAQRKVSKYLFNETETFLTAVFRRFLQSSSQTIQRQKGESVKL